MSANSGRIRKRPAAISPATAANEISTICQPGGASAIAGLRLIAVTSVIIGMIERS